MAVKTLTLSKLESGDNHFFRCRGIINQKMFRKKIKPKLANNLTFFLNVLLQYFYNFRMWSIYFENVIDIAEGVNAKNN